MADNLAVIERPVTPPIRADVRAGVSSLALRLARAWAVGDDAPMGILAGFSHVALSVRDIRISRTFYEQTLGLQLLDSSETYCAFLTGSAGLSALILTSHENTRDEPFTELRPGLDHVSLAVADLPALKQWQTELTARGVPSDLRRSEWGHHLNFRDPDNIAIEFVFLEPGDDVQAVLDLPMDGGPPA